jgi:GTP-binding protein
MKADFLKSAFLESHYPSPDKPEIAFAGRSNVGKSSLINALLGRKKLARTSSTPGRTQALNFFLIQDRYYFVDLPGYGYARVPLEVKRSWGTMVETYLRKRANLKGVVLILDIRREPTEGDIQLLEWLNRYRIHSISVLTKADKLSRSRSAARAGLISEQLKAFAPDTPTVFSAKTLQGRQGLWQLISGLIEVENPPDRKP